MGLSAFIGIVIVALTTFRFIIADLTNPRRHIPGPWWALPLHQRYGPVILVAPNEISVGSLEGLQRVHKMGTGFIKGALHVNFRIGPEPSLFDMTDTNLEGSRGAEEVVLPGVHGAVAAAELAA